jgi:hypothetical protein
MREGSDRIAGVLRSEGQEFPLFDVKQTGSEVTFSVVIPGTPYETILYRGMVSDERMELAGLGEQQGAYALTATRQAPSIAAASAVAASRADASGSSATDARAAAGTAAPSRSGTAASPGAGPGAVAASAGADDE